MNLWHSKTLGIVYTKVYIIGYLNNCIFVHNCTVWFFLPFHNLQKVLSLLLPFTYRTFTPMPPIMHRARTTFCHFTIIQCLCSHNSELFVNKLVSLNSKCAYFSLCNSCMNRFFSGIIETHQFMVVHTNMSSNALIPRKMCYVRSCYLSLLSLCSFLNSRMKNVTLSHPKRPMWNNRKTNNQTSTSYSPTL